MNLKIESCLTLLGRILLSLIFILSGFGKIGDWSGTASYMASKGMVAIPFFLPMAILSAGGVPKNPRKGYTP